MMKYSIDEVFFVFVMFLQVFVWISWVFLIFSTVYVHMVFEGFCLKLPYVSSVLHVPAGQFNILDPWFWPFNRAPYRGQLWRAAKYDKQFSAQRQNLLHQQRHKNLERRCTSWGWQNCWGRRSHFRETVPRYWRANNRVFLCFLLVRDFVWFILILGLPWPIMAFPRLIYFDFVLVIGLYWPAVAMFHLLLMERYGKSDTSQTVLQDILQDHTVHGCPWRHFKRVWKLFERLRFFPCLCISLSCCGHMKLLAKTGAKCLLDIIRSHQIHSSPWRT